MKLGVSTFTWAGTFDQPMYSLLSSIREHGFSAIEVPMFDPAVLPAREIQRAIEASQLASTVCAILPAGINPISADAAVRQRSLAHLIRCVETTAELGATLIGGPVYAPIGYLPGRRRTEEEWDWAVACLQALTPTLDAHRITLALEPVNRSETFFLTTLAEATALCDDVDHPRIGVLVDTFHSSIEEKNTANAILALGRRLRHIHASENDRGILGTGHVDFTAIIEALRRMDYDGYLMIEGLGTARLDSNLSDPMWRRPSETPEAIAWQGALYLRELLAAAAL